MVLLKDWHTHAGYREIFNAALSGICANPHFNPAAPDAPQAAVEFAFDVVRAADALVTGNGEDNGQ